MMSSSSAQSIVVGQGASAPKKYRSRMMEYFQLESPHRGPYVPGTVSTQARTASIVAQLDKHLKAFDGTDDNISVAVSASATALDSKSQ